MTAKTAKVILFKSSGKYYTSEEWRIPESVPDHSEHRGDFVREVIGPFDMLHSPDFRRIDGGAVLVESQEPWGYPHLFPGETVEPAQHPSVGTNTGHGHVWLRPDGMRARCGGPGLCSVCRSDEQMVKGWKR